MGVSEGQKENPLLRTILGVQKGADMATKMCLLIPAMISAMSLYGCQGLSDRDTARIKLEIESSLKGASQAWESFPRTLDPAGMLKYYATDYSGVKDGVSEDIKDLGKSFDAIAEQIKLGDRLGISYKMTESNIRPFTEHLALVTYKDETVLGRDGRIQSYLKYRCSTFMRKEGENWLIFHEHCSHTS